MPLYYSPYQLVKSLPKFSNLLVVFVTSQLNSTNKNLNLSHIHMSSLLFMEVWRPHSYTASSLSPAAGPSLTNIFSYSLWLFPPNNPNQRLCWQYHQVANPDAGYDTVLLISWCFMCNPNLERRPSQRHVALLKIGRVIQTFHVLTHGILLIA